MDGSWENHGKLLYAKNGCSYHPYLCNLPPLKNVLDISLIQLAVSAILNWFDSKINQLYIQYFLPISLKCVHWFMWHFAYKHTKKTTQWWSFPLWVVILCLWLKHGIYLLMFSFEEQSSVQFFDGTVLQLQSFQSVLQTQRGTAVHLVPVLIQLHQLWDTTIIIINTSSLPGPLLQ